MPFNKQTETEFAYRAYEINFFQSNIKESQNNYEFTVFTKNIAKTKILFYSNLFICLVCCVGFYVISTIVGYLISNSLYAYILNIYDLV